jgi:hypothetical protein
MSQDTTGRTPLIDTQGRTTPGRPTRPNYVLNFRRNRCRQQPRTNHPRRQPCWNVRYACVHGNRCSIPSLGLPTSCTNKRVRRAGRAVRSSLARCIQVLPNNASALRAAGKPERGFCCPTTRGRPTCRGQQASKRRRVVVRCIDRRFPNRPRLSVVFGTQPASKARDNLAAGFGLDPKPNVTYGQRAASRTIRRQRTTAPSRPAPAFQQPRPQ